MARSILILLAHPARASFCHALAEAYRQGAETVGHRVRLLAVGDMAFDPILHEGYNIIQPLEPDLEQARDAILDADHLVFVYPTWWGGPPALLKGFLDRVFLPGFAFKYRENSRFWDRLLAGRSAHLLVTMDTPPWYYRWIYRMPGHNLMKRTVLEFSGIKPVKLSSIGPVRQSTPEQREQWLDRARAWGRKA